jgi:tetratricopeptide (TPR) repeat protein
MKIFLTVYAFAILFICMPARLFSQQQKAAELTRYAGYLFNNRKYDSAIIYCNKAISLNPAIAKAFFVRGRSYSGRHNYPQAVFDFSKAIELEPGNDSAFYFRAWAYDSTGNPNKAISDFNKALELNPHGFIYAYNGRGNAYQWAGNDILATADYGRAIEADPSGAYTYLLNRGDLYYARELYDSAIADYSKASKINPKNPEPFVSRGDCYERKGSSFYDLAVSDYNKAIELNPKYSDAYLMRGDIFRNRGSNDLAFIDYNRAIELDPRTADGYNDRGHIYRLKGDYEKAVKDYKTALSIDSMHKYAIINILPCLIRMNKFDEAAAFYNSYKAKNISSFIENRDWGYYKLYLESATAFCEFSHYKEALEQIHIAEKKYNSYTAAISSNIAFTRISYSDVLALKGYISEKLNLPGDAAAAYNQALVINASQPDVTQGLARTRGLKNLSGNESIPLQAAGIPSLDNLPRYHAILIAEQSYADPAIGNLTKPIEDALKLKHLLETEYTFLPADIDTLFNRSRDDVLETIIHKCNTLKSDDNLLIFYSGHGTADKDQFGNIRGYLVPSSARKEKIFTYISFNDIVVALGRGDTRHILFIADACFSGALKDIPKDAPKDAKLSYASMSRKIMTSGNLEPVPDNSVFQYYLLKTLFENTEKYLTADKLFGDIRRKVEFNGNTKPQYIPIRDTGDEGGDFVFIKK